MSIAERIASMSNNLSDAYDGIEYLGVDTTGVDKNLQNLSSMLNVVYEGLPKVSDEGVSPSIVGSRVGRLKSTLKASDTTQESTTGKNLLPIKSNLVEKTINGMTFTPVYENNLLQYINVNGTTTASAVYDIISTSASSIKTISAGTYQLNTNKTSGEVKLFCDLKKEDESSIYPESKNASTSITLTGNTRILRSYLQILSGKTCNNEKIYPQLEQDSTATSYEPYTNGASPNPDYPQDIHVVKGNNTVEVGGIQIFDINDIENGYFTGDSGVANTSPQGFHTTKYIPVGDNAKIYFRFEALDNIQIGRFFVQEYDENFISLKRTSSSVYDTKFTEGQVRKYNITLNEKTKYVRFSTYLIKVLENETYVEKQPAKDYWGTYIKTTVSFTDVDIYKDYEYSSYPINLPEGLELCKTNTYQDKLFKAVSGDTVYDTLTSEQKEGLVSGGWYKYNAVGKVVLNGSEEGWAYAATISRFGINQLIQDYSINNRTYSICDHYTYGDTTLNGFFALSGSNNALFMHSPNDNTNTVSLFQAWLSAHRPKIYYPLRTPTITQITDTTLISQLEALYGAMSKNGQTNVLQTNTDNPFVIFASALKGE